SGDLEQSLVQQLAYELQQIGAQALRLDVEFALHPVRDRSESAVLAEQLPHARADRIETEVDAGLDVQQRDLIANAPERDARGNPHLVIQRWGGHRFPVSPAAARARVLSAARAAPTCAPRQGSSAHRAPRGAVAARPPMAASW